ncbi:MAG: biliverdin-producing heme oxygenase [Marinobacter sp.]|uniref:biliverdin-producing heme oxygenase n=1 Tax=Marinobacter sp. TaxID=50741 RepID=UPI003F9DE454
MHTIEVNSAISLTALLKTGTTREHEKLDKRIMALSPFSSRERYALFVRTQARLHRVVAPCYQNPVLKEWLPDLEERNRLEAVLADCGDFDISSAALQEDADVSSRVGVDDAYAALGWLYTVEGSNLGAAFLLKHAKKELALSETFGARHLAGNSDGRGAFWKRFKEGLDGIDLTETQRQAALGGALEAFAFARAGVEELLAPFAEADSA